MHTYLGNTLEYIVSIGECTPEISIYHKPLCLLVARIHISRMAKKPILSLSLFIGNGFEVRHESELQIT